MASRGQSIFSSGVLRTSDTETRLVAYKVLILSNLTLSIIHASFGILT